MTYHTVRVYAQETIIYNDNFNTVSLDEYIDFL